MFRWLWFSPNTCWVICVASPWSTCISCQVSWVPKMENIFWTGPEAVNLEWILHLSLKIWRWKYFLKSPEVCHDQIFYSLQAVLHYLVDVFKEGHQEHPWNHRGCNMPGDVWVKSPDKMYSIKNWKVHEWPCPSKWVRCIQGYFLIAA